jgi:putative nucleotidyltransferase with HDIG domain
VIDNTLHAVGDDPNIMSLLNFLQSDGDQAYSHSVAISMYSCMIAREMGLTSQTVQVRLALGGLMHDIGKKELPFNVLCKSRIEMTAQEFKLYETHCQRGKEILSDIPGIPEDVIQIAAHHHENNVGTGFPYHLRSTRIHPLAKIVAVADCFFHTMQKMGVVDASGIEGALNKMTVIHELEFDQDVVKALSELVSEKQK